MKTSKTMAVVNFVYFLANFPGQFSTIIDLVWKDNPLLAIHFNQKFDSCFYKYSKNGTVTPAVIIAFFFDLSDTNKLQFVNWIDTNYHFSSEHETGNF